MRGEIIASSFPPFVFSIPLNVKIKKGKEPSEDQKAYERHGDGELKLWLRCFPCSWSLLGHLGYAESNHKANQTGYLAAIMQRPQHGNMLSQLSYSWAVRDPIRIPRASLHRGHLRVQTIVLLNFHKSLGHVCVCECVYVCVCVCVCARDQFCSTVYDPINCSLPGSSVHRIFQARILEWVAISCSRGLSPPRDQICVSEREEEMQFSIQHYFDLQTN